MTKTFIQTKEFSKNWDKLGFKDADLRKLETELFNNANTFPVVKGTGGLRKMSDVYESIMTGLSEAVEDAKSKKKMLKRRVVTVMPVKEYQPEEVKKIRNTVGMSQKIFASYLGVSDKTVEAWESGTNHPSGAASRLLNMMEMNEKLIEEFPFVVAEKV